MVKNGESENNFYEKIRETGKKTKAIQKRKKEEELYSSLKNFKKILSFYLCSSFYNILDIGDLVCDLFTYFKFSEN